APPAPSFAPVPSVPPEPSRPPEADGFPPDALPPTLSALPPRWPASLPASPPDVTSPPSPEGAPPIPPSPGHFLTFSQPMNSVQPGAKNREQATAAAAAGPSTPGERPKNLDTAPPRTAAPAPSMRETLARE